ncbi:GntR family transcriptional regulator [Filobacillus milosensis]|uniref:GntR family transcriptional regulator n=1 Tax=Filobacillus milosensis TaxID=94137 RepID=A0A4Y8ITB7_9BACI|nr:GntR family transcriptional regulator [Filobacillus milosensis]TFB25104.1 GntR family transcriptional regulator [Filobacillus milosensis]
MKIKFNNRDPVYVQVIRHFKNQIAKGFLEPGQAIPSRRELANQLKINPNTAQRAFKEMEEEGLIKTERNQPSRVTSDENILQDLRDELIIQAVNEFVHSVKSINVPLDDALNLVKQKYGKEKGDLDD